MVWFWFILGGFACLLLGFIMGTNAGKDAFIRMRYTGYYDASGSRAVYFDPDADEESIKDKDYVVLEVVNLSRPIHVIVQK